MQGGGDIEREVARIIARRLRGAMPAAGPLLASLSLASGIALELAGAPLEAGLVLLYPALLGGFLEFYLLLHLARARRLVSGSLPGGFRLVVRAAWSVPFYYTILGLPLVAWQVKANAEHVLERGIEETVCGRYYNHLFFIVTLGFALAVFQRCIATLVAERLEGLLSESPEGLGAEGYEGEEYPGRPDTPVDNPSPG